jgi:hypothetical protein
MNVTVFPLLLLQLRRNEAVMGFSCSSDTRDEKCLYNVDESAESWEALKQR